ncbi:MAG: AAA family ATPase [Candidatus Magasanikiibacteriota bacterium]
MQPELSIIKLLLIYNQWLRNKDGLSTKDLSKEVQPLFSLVDSFHRQNTNGLDLSLADLANLVAANRGKDLDFQLGMLAEIEKLSVGAESTERLIFSIKQHKLLKEISLSAYDVTEGRLPPEKLKEMFREYEGQQTVAQQDDVEFITDDLEELVNGSIRNHGLRWRLSTLNQMLGSLRTGDFGFIFARPETGKTTFLASETTYMAEQLTEESGPIIWLNNEEQGNKVKLRCYQASLGLTMPQLFADLPGNREKYMQKTKGKLKIYDSGNIHKNTVEQLCRQYKPSLIIFDQVDKIQGFHDDREDLRLGAIYIWARELAKKWAPVIGVCQSDGTGEGVKWLTMSNVANAKTSKQAEADWILGVGKVHDPGYEAIRYLHLCKNKLAGDTDTLPDQRHGRREVLINAQVARYEDI